MRRPRPSNFDAACPRGAGQAANTRRVGRWPKFGPSWVVPLVALLGCATPPPTGPAPGTVAVERLPQVSDAAARSPVPAQRVSHQEEVAPAPSNALFFGPTAVDTVIAYAVMNNPEVAAARAKAEALIARVPQARSWEDPMLSATVFLQQIQTAAGPQEAMLSLTQKFPWFGKRQARGEVAFHEAQSAFAEWADVELAVVEQVKLAYFELFFLDQAIRVYRRLKPNLEDVVAVTRTRYETDTRRVGLESVLAAEVAMHKLDVILVELEQARLQANARLARALHLPDGLTLDIEPELPEAVVPRDAALLVQMVEMYHPQLLARRHAIVRDDWSVALARKNYYPDVNLGLNWYSIGAEGLTPFSTGNDAYSLMVGLNLPMYRAKREAALREARFGMAASTRRYEATWDMLRAEVQSLHAQVVEHERVLQILSDDILRKAEQSYELSIAAYRVDRIDFQQLIDSYEDLLRFRIEYFRRRVKREQAVARLERVVGCAVSQWSPAPLAPAELPVPHL